MTDKGDKQSTDQIDIGTATANPLSTSTLVYTRRISEACTSDGFNNDKGCQ